MSSYVRIIYAATDASRERGGWVIFDADRIRAAGLVPEGILRYRSTTRLEETEQVWSEGRAVNDLAEAIDVAGPTLVLVAIDADSVTTSINKGYSSSPQLTSYLVAAQAREDLRFVATRVAGIDNFADIPSRSHANLQKLIAAGDAEAVRRYKATWRALSELERSLR